MKEGEMCSFAANAVSMVAALERFPFLCKLFVPEKDTILSCVLVPQIGYVINEQKSASLEHQLELNEFVVRLPDDVTEHYLAMERRNAQQRHTKQ